ncbi:hypothetical protein OIU85_012265 [Salix viminalis]|uniref:V-SNARE coiled-coil homology domain-containing protein n=2 Tax=Salix TaxID=40685 RepID=A0A9Q0NNX4_SALVM|nr:hypothetical protein OIU85_012265 [Salix viminalis]
MGILYGMVARGLVVLAEFSSVAQTNANTIARQILDKIPRGNEDSNSSYSHDRYIFHVKRTDGLIVLCMADDATGRECNDRLKFYAGRIPFEFLEDIHQRFVKTYGRAIHTASPYAMNEDFSRILSQQMDHYSNDPNADRLNRLQGEMSHVRTVMIDNIDKVLQRGDRLALLVEKTSTLQGNTIRFRRQTQRFRKAQWWRDFKLKLCTCFGCAFSYHVVFKKDNLLGYVDSISLDFHLHCARIVLPWPLTSFLLEVKLTRTRSAAAAAGWFTYLQLHIDGFGLLLSLCNFLIQIKFSAAILALSRSRFKSPVHRGFVRNPDTQPGQAVDQQDSELTQESTGQSPRLPISILEEVFSNCEMSERGFLDNSVKKSTMLQPVEFEGNNSNNNVSGLLRKRKLECGTGCIENNRLRGDVQCAGGGYLAVGCQDNFGERNRVRGGGDVTIRKETGVVVGKSGHSLLEMSPKHRRNGSPVESIDESKSHVGKLASIAAEKLWDGSLQLNSSVTVSLVAFFKSGEKMPVLKWSEFLEVKGKVRLEAFEKYVQDLPRSRNRGLMVISLCCKEGSSKSGLAGMKEVSGSKIKRMLMLWFAKGYKKGKRVGFVQLSQGIDLYVCPRSDSIITILAKHGFFKGMAAVEGNQDSLIGCVVWRRNQASSSSVLEKSERKHGSLYEQPLKSPSDSSVERVDHKDLSCCIQVGSRTDCSTLDGDENNNFEHKDIETKQVQTELPITSSTINNLLLTSTVLSNSPSMLNGLQTSSTHDSASYLPAMGKLLQVGPLMNKSEEKHKTTELHKPGSHLSTGITKKPLHAPYDDDLPEFDFGTACADNKLPAEELKKILESLPQITPTVQSMLASNQREFIDFNPPRLPLDTLLKMPLQKKICVDGMNVPLPNLEEKYPSPSKMPVTTTAARPLKNLFDDDDDDMPEWSPPDIVSYTTRKSTTYTYSKVRNLSFERLPPGCPNNLLSSSPRSAYAPITPQAGISAVHQLMSHNGRPAHPSLSGEYILHGPNSSTVFNTNPLPLSRPPRDPFDAKLPVHYDGWNRRRC